MSGRIILSAIFALLTIFASPNWAQTTTQEPMTGIGKGGNATVSIPKEYGKLVSVVESNGIHYLYFQDDEGNIRIFLLGIKGSASRAKTDLEALPHSVYKISRSEE